MAGKTEMIAVRLEPFEATALRQMAEEADVTVSELVRGALRRRMVERLAGNATTSERRRGHIPDTAGPEAAGAQADVDSAAR